MNSKEKSQFVETYITKFCVNDLMNHNQFSRGGGGYKYKINTKFMNRGDATSKMERALSLSHQCDIIDVGWGLGLFFT